MLGQNWATVRKKKLYAQLNGDFRKYRSDDNIETSPIDEWYGLYLAMPEIGSSTSR